MTSDNAATSSSLPPRTSVVVIGGGVMGCSVLYHLAQAGTDCVLVEKHKLSAGTTWHSAAQVRTLRAVKSLTQMARYAIELYPRLEDETGQSTGWINTGAVSVAVSPDRLIHIHRQKAVSDFCGARAEFVSPEVAREKWPLLNIDDVQGAIWSPDDGRVGPTDLCAALAKGASQSGAQVVEDTDVCGIILRNGRVAGVETSRGEILCDAIAVCAGLWSRDIAKLAGANAQLWPCEHYYLLTRPFANIDRLPVLTEYDSHLYVRDESGGLLVGCFEPHARVADTSRLQDFAFDLLPEDWDHFEPMMQNALHRIPELANAEIKTLVNGPESFTPDGKCLLGETRETPGLFLGCGMNSVGVVSGAGAGRALAEIILGLPPSIALPEADPKRFPDCWNSAEALSARAPETLGTTYDIHYPGWQQQTARNLVKLPLHEVWIKHKAHFAQMYGAERPLFFNKLREPVLTFARPEWFAQMNEEVRCASEQAAVFDLSAFGMISVRGPDAEQFLNRICANNMTRAPGRVIYTALLNKHGGIEGDLTAMRISDEHYLLYTGAGETGRDFAHLRAHLQPQERVQLADETGQRAVLGLFGAGAAEMSAVSELKQLRYFQHVESEIAGCPVRAARLSFVGEFGWEISCDAKDAATVFAALSAEGAQPAGWFALNSMRIEKQFLAYYRDLDPGISPLQAGLEFAVDWNKEFIGKTSLLKQKEQKLDKRIVSVVLHDKNAEPVGEETVYDGDKICGRLTSASFGCRMQKPVALAFVDAEVAQDNKNVTVDIAGEKFTGDIVVGAAFDSGGERMKERR